MDIRELVNRAVADAVSQAVAEALANVNMAPATPVIRDSVRRQVVAAPDATAARRRRSRRPAPAVGYHAGAGIDKRTVKRIAAQLPGNPGAVLADIVAHPGSTNRAIAQRMVVEHDWSAESAKKATESALYQLRVHDADWNVLDLTDKRAAKKALAVSRELAE